MSKSSKKWLLKVPDAQAVLNNVVKDGVVVRKEVVEIVSATTGYGFALEAVTSGEKVFSIWEMRKRIKKFEHPTEAWKNARYIVLDEEERETLLRGFKTIDWTFKGAITFWVRWEEFFSTIQNMVEFDETNPPIEYLQDKKRFEDEIEAYNAAQKALEEKRLAELKEETDGILAEKLAELQQAGKLGPAATVDDLSAEIRKDAELAAKTAIEQKRKVEAAVSLQSQDVLVKPETSDKTEE